VAWGEARVKPPGTDVISRLALLLRWLLLRLLLGSGGGAVVGVGGVGGVDQHSSQWSRSRSPWSSSSSSSEEGAGPRWQPPPADVPFSVCGLGSRCHRRRSLGRSHSF